MAPKNIIIPRPVFYTLQISKIRHFGTLGLSNSCLSLGRGAFSHIFTFFILFSNMGDFCLKNDLVLAHLDGLKRSKNRHENQAYFWSHFGSILDLILGPVGSIIGPKWYQNSAHGPRGGQGGPKWSFWTILDLILEHFGLHFGQVSYQSKRCIDNNCRYQQI